MDEVKDRPTQCNEIKTFNILVAIIQGKNRLVFSRGAGTTLTNTQWV